MGKKIRVAVLMGGKSPEHEISIISGREVVANLDTRKFEALPVVISKDGKSWRLTTKEEILTLPDPLKLKETKKDIVLVKASEIEGVRDIDSRNADIVFVAMHGPFGEDGTVQGMLELAGLKYTGPGVLASAVGMDKIVFRKLMRFEKIPVPKYVVFKKGEKVSKIVKALGRPPYFVKPHNQGSSVGASIVRKKKDLTNALKLALSFSDTCLIDEYIKGKEVTVSVLGDEKPRALPVIEIIPKKAAFFDYESKYTESGAEEIVPARISTALTKRVQETAIRVYQAVGSRGFSRIDLLLKEGKYPLVLEINTIPGLTPMSLFPKAAKAAGISYPKLLEEIIGYALKQDLI